MNSYFSLPTIKFLCQIGRTGHIDEEAYDEVKEVEGVSAMRKDVENDKAFTTPKTKRRKSASSSLRLSSGACTCPSCQLLALSRVPQPPR